MIALSIGQTISSGPVAGDRRLHLAAGVDDLDRERVAELGQRDLGALAEAVVGGDEEEDAHCGEGRGAGAGYSSEGAGARRDTGLEPQLPHDRDRSGAAQHEARPKPARVLTLGAGATSSRARAIASSTPRSSLRSSGPLPRDSGWRRICSTWLSGSRSLVRASGA